MKRVRTLAIVLTAVLTACATALPAAPINRPATFPENPAPALHVGPDGEAIVLALSGGGARAAAFSLGVLQGLREAPAADGRALLDHVALVSAVSGGAILAAYYGLHGSPGLDTFRAAYLDKDWVSALHTSPASPANWLRAWRGGMNDETKLADWLDREIFQGAPMHMLWRGPQVWLNAVDLYNGTPFAFAPAYFDALCSDLAGVRVADAVAASMAMPVIFEPILIEPQRQHCAPQPDWVARALNDREAPALLRVSARAFQSYRDPARLRFVHLADGGVVDNLGLSSLSLMLLTAPTPYAPLSEQGAVRLTRLRVLVVNAENIRTADWRMDAEGPSGAEIIDTVYDVATEASNRAAYDGFRAIIAQWERDLIAWRCGLASDDVARWRGGLAGWNCADPRLSVDMIAFADLDETLRARVGAIATRVSLPAAADIDALIASGRAGLLANALAR